jgi:ATP-dependent Clp protease ATP-binding subunit ClpC
LFERFTERARQVVVLAQDEARALRHDFIGTEHLLLGLLREEEGIAARVLARFGLTSEGARVSVARVVGQGDEVTTAQIPFTPRAKKVLELALREALALGDNYIGTEHILLGLVHGDDGLAARILLDHGADPESVRSAVIGDLSGSSRGSAAAGTQDPTSRTVREDDVTVGGSSPPAFRDYTEVEYSTFERASSTSVRLALSGLLFAVALAIGILIGWLIWG